MRNIWIVLICLVIVLPIAQGNSLNHTRSNGQSPSRADLLDGGWLEERENVTILHVNGSNYQMGYQHGYLLREKVQENIRAFLHFANTSISYDALLTMWDTMDVYIPQECKDELQGIADGANISFNDIAVSIAAIEYADHGCYGIAAWGPATIDGKLYHARSFDLPSTIQDPVTGRYAHENTVLVVRKPTNGSVSLCPSIAGSFHTGGGINEHGIALGIQICWSKDQTFQGNPYHFRVQQVLDYATTAEEALQILNTNRTHGFNFIVSQATPAEGFALEQSANYTYVGSYDNPVESTSPFWAIEHVVRRTNVFIDPTIAATQRKRYDPTGFIGFLNLLLYKKTNCPFFAVYQLYSSVSKGLNISWGTMDLNGTMAVLQNGYRASDFPLLRLIEILGKGTGMAEAWNQWTACPENGDMVVSFATHDQMAYQTEPHYFNLYSLLQEQQP
ncbi:MAG: C45 family autoproteolytic acyltransferase/hydrolase [Euryarchaeota archaeon]|nr:C45 family autoproteolytic acyltransferase/hydrolase [Euryarchaeota archaeon]